MVHVCVCACHRSMAVLHVMPDVAEIPEVAGGLSKYTSAVTGGAVFSDPRT